MISFAATISQLPNIAQSPDAGFRTKVSLASGAFKIYDFISCDAIHYC